MHCNRYQPPRRWCLALLHASLSVSTSAPAGSGAITFTFCKKMRILISGGPGSGCTSTSLALGVALKLSVFDSDSYFHKLTNPLFQEQHSPNDRRELVISALSGNESWILSGSVATWGLCDLFPTHGVFLGIPPEERLRRAEQRQRAQYGSRIDYGGDMAEEHKSFSDWASGYESRTGIGRNAATDLSFLESRCDHCLVITESSPIQQVVTEIVAFLTETPNAEQAAPCNTH